MQLDAAREGLKEELAQSGGRLGQVLVEVARVAEESDQFKDEHHKCLRWQERVGEGERRRVRIGEHHKCCGREPETEEREAGLLLLLLAT